jgi:hypothetical protein
MLNIDPELLHKQQLLIAEMIHDQHDRYRVNKEERALLEGVWELLITLENQQQKPANHENTTPGQSAAR